METLSDRWDMVGVRKSITVAALKNYNASNRSVMLHMALIKPVARPVFHSRGANPGL